MKKAIVLLLSAVLIAPSLPAFAQEDKAEKKQTRAEKRAERRAEREHRREERQAKRDAKHKKSAPPAEEKK